MTNDRKPSGHAAKRRLTPAELALLHAAGPTYLDAARIEPPESTLAGAIDPDDWRLYHLMRELPQADRARVLEMAELLYNLRHAQRWAEDLVAASQLGLETRAAAAGE
jgi:hypothetical protein